MAIAWVSIDVDNLPFILDSEYIKLHTYINRSQILSLTDYFSYLIKIMTQIDFYHRTYMLMYSQDCDNWTTNEIRILFEVRDCGSRKIIAKYNNSNHPHMLPIPSTAAGTGWGKYDQL